jgi:hypothetical protein
MTKRIVTFSALAAAALTGSAFAGKAVVDHKTTKEIVKESCITGDLGVDFTSNYISRGIPQENQGFIAQPYADLYFKLYEGSGALSKLSLNLGVWSSIHGHRNQASAGGGSVRSWYEFDYSVGLTFQFGNLSVTPSFLAILSPNDTFADNYNAQITIAYDDSELLGAFALHPHLTVLAELEGKAGSGPDTGIYYEIGIAPSVKVGEGTLSFPINVGLGSDGFYGTVNGDDTYGYFSAGLALEWPLNFVPECLGSWALKANATYYNLGDNAAAAGTPFVIDGDHDQYAFGGGIVVRF